MIQISKLINNDEKQRITNSILRELPEWFGIEEAIVEYVNGVKILIIMLHIIQIQQLHS